MNSQKSKNELDLTSDNFSVARQDFKEECRLFRKDMHIGFDSLHKHFDEIYILLDTNLSIAKKINNYIDITFNLIFFLIGVFLFNILV
jgi:hypothetical protein